MKKIAHTLVGLLLPTLLTVLAACHRHGPYPAGLLRADSLCEVAPDSARSVLHAMQDDMDDAPLSTRMYHRLLCIKAADKADVPITSDSAIRPVLRYYEHDGGDPALLPEALYYGGRTYRELGDAPQALDYFDRAINALPDGVDDGLKSNIYSQRGQLFIFQDMYPEAREMFRASLECDLRIQDSVKMVYALRDIGFCYQSEELMDSAAIYYRKAYQTARQQGKGIQQMMQISRGGFFLRCQQYNSAWAVIAPYLHSKEVKNDSKSAVYSIAAQLYQNTGQTDSAFVYSQRLLDFGTIYAKQTACRILTQISLQRGNKDAASYLDRYLQYTDSIQEITKTETIRKANALYNYNLRKQENLRLKATVRNREQTVFSLSVFLLSVIACAILGMYLFRERNKRKYYQERSELYEKMEKAEQHLRQMEKERTTIVNELQQIQLKTEQDRKEYCEQIARYEAQRHIYEEKLAESQRQKTVSNTIPAYPTIRKMKDILSTQQKMGPKERIELRQALFDCYATCVERLTKDYDMRRDDIYLCLLLKAGFDIKEISFLTCRTETAIRMSLSRNCYNTEKGINGLADLKRVISCL